MDDERLDGFTGGEIAFDLDDEELGSATLNADANMGIDDQYVRIYQVVEQQRSAERFCMGTFLVLCPTEDFDGTRAMVDANGYTPLHELADDVVPVGYAVQGDAAQGAASLMGRHLRAPVIRPATSVNLDGHFAAQDDESYLSYVKSMLATAKMRLKLDARGNVGVEPMRDAAAMRPVWTFADDEVSVILPEISDESKLRDVPNVVRVVYSTEETCLVAEAVNDDPDSPASTVTRGRRVTHVERNPELPENPQQIDLEYYAKRKLRELSTYENEITFSHAYIPEVTVGSAVRLDYGVAGKRVTVLVEAQGITLDEACTVECRGVYTTNVWRG
jgi:hypothetical protein